MPRPTRIVATGATYHITARGINGEAIFRDVYDRYDYLALLAKAKRKLRMRLIAYALMTNHVHLVVQTDGVSISSVVQMIHGEYAAAFNRKFGRTGHLFGGRFYSRLVEREEYLLELTRYVHLNPVRSGLGDRPEDYPWSSYRLYVSPEITQSLIDPAPVLRTLSSSPQRGRRAYARFVTSVENQGGRWSIGDDPKTLAESVTRLVAGTMNLTEHEVLQTKRGAEARATVLLLLRNMRKFSYETLGEVMGLRPSGVWSAISRLQRASAVDVQRATRLDRLSRALSMQDSARVHPDR